MAAMYLRKLAAQYVVREAETTTDAKPMGCVKPGGIVSSRVTPPRAPNYD